MTRKQTFHNVRKQVKTKFFGLLTKYIDINQPKLLKDVLICILITAYNPDKAIKNIIVIYREMGEKLCKTF